MWSDHAKYDPSSPLHCQSHTVSWLAVANAQLAWLTFIQFSWDLYTLIVFNWYFHWLCVEVCFSAEMKMIKRCRWIMLGWPFFSLPNSKATQRRASTAPAALFVHEKCWVNTFRLWFGLVAVREFNAVDLTNVKQWGLERGCWLDEPSQMVRFVLPYPPNVSGS